MAERKPTKRAPNFKDMTGMVFGRLSVIQLHAGSSSSAIRWECICECGKDALVLGSLLRSGMTRSCGCYRDDRIRATTSTHGKSNTKEYGIWQQAKNRCFSPTVKGYAYYGSRGITMCDEWRDDFMAFFRDMGPCPDGLSLERVNNDGNYEKSNCKWATKSEQARNTRAATFITHDGLTLSLPAWAERTGIKYKTLHLRHRRGRNLFAPLQRPGRKG